MVSIRYSLFIIVLAFLCISGNAHAQSAVTYQYDALGRLIGATHTSAGSVETYDYDAAGNRDTVEVTGVSANQSPTATDDSLNVTPNTPESFNPRNNDTDPDGDGLKISAASTPAHGDVVVHGGLTLTYTPDTSYQGSDSFTYTVSDGRGGQDTATVTVDVGAGNFGIAFDSSSDALKVTSFTGFPTGAMTVEIQSKRLGASSGSLGSDTPFSYATSTQSDEFRVRVLTTQAARTVLNGTSVSGSAVAFDGNRHRLTITRVTGTNGVHQYVDGVLGDTLTGPSSSLGSSGTLILGHNQASMGVLGVADAAFVGEIYRVRIWNRELSAAEVSAGTTTSGLVADFDFTEGSGTTTASSVGSYVATFLGTPTWVPDSGGSGGSTTLDVADPAAVTEGANVVFTVSRTGTATGVQTIDYATSSGTATSGSDFTAATGTLTFQTTDTSKTVTVSTSDDSTAESAETFNLTLSGPTGGASLGDGVAVGTLNDNDGGGSTTVYSIAPSSATEGGTITFTVSRTGTAVGTETIQYATSSGTATSGTDFTAASNTLTFLTSDTSKTFTVNTTQDTTYEGNETLTATLSANSAGTIGTANGTGTINEDDTAPSFAVAASSATEGGTITFTVTKAGATALAHAVNYASSSGTATQGTDFTGATGTLNFASGDTTRTFTVNTTQDSSVEGNETLTVTLSGPTAGATIGTATATGTIIDDDGGSTAVYSIANASATEGGSITFTVSRTGTPVGVETIQYATSSGTATSGTDFTAASGTLTFQTSDTSKTFTVSTTGDTTYEANETLTATLSSASAGTISQATATGTINNNDTAPSFAINNSSATEGSSVTFTVTKTGSTALTHAVNYATSSGTATSGTDFTAKSGTLTFTSGQTTQTFSVTTTNDSTVESNETFNITLSSATNGATISDSSGVGTINDNDGPSTLTSSSGTVLSGHTGTYSSSMTCQFIGYPLNGDFCTYVLQISSSSTTVFSAFGAQGLGNSIPTTSINTGYTRPSSSSLAITVTAAKYGQP